VVGGFEIVISVTECDGLGGGVKKKIPDSAYVSNGQPHKSLLLDVVKNYQRSSFVCLGEDFIPVIAACPPLL